MATQYTLCINDAKGVHDGRKGFWCSKAGADDFFVSYEDADNYFALPFDDGVAYFKGCAAKRVGH